MRKVVMLLAVMLMFVGCVGEKGKLQSMKVNFDNHNFEVCRDIFKNFNQNNNDSEYFVEVKEIMGKIILIEEKEIKFEKLVKEKQKQAHEKALKEKNNPFKKKHFVNDFGEQTNDKYIVQYIDGIFSNSATDNSPAYLSLIYAGNSSKDTSNNMIERYNGNRTHTSYPYDSVSPSIRFDIREYTFTNKAHFSSYDSYWYRLKDDAGNVLTGSIDEDSSSKGTLQIHSDKLFQMMKRAKEIKILIYKSDSDTKYYFTINCNGFIDRLQYLKN